MDCVSFCLVIAVVSVVGKFAAKDVLVQLLDRFLVPVESLHASRQALARRQVDVLQSFAVFEKPCQSLQVDRAAAEVEFSENEKFDISKVGCCLPDWAHLMFTL